VGVVGRTPAFACEGVLGVGHGVGLLAAIRVALSETFMTMNMTNQVSVWWGPIDTKQPASEAQGAG
jgi:hypothetical protein